jgi:hypothetical protein
VGAGVFGEAWLGYACGHWAAAFSPWEAIREATRPNIQAGVSGLAGLWGAFRPIEGFLQIGILITVLLNGIAVAMVRIWNPSREAGRATREDETWRRESIWGAEYDAAQEAEQAQALEGGDPPAGASEPARLEPARSKTRTVWDNPIIWREMRTWAYGRKVLVIRLAYVILFGLTVAGLHLTIAAGDSITGEAGSLALVALLFLSLVLVNAQAVTSLTNERDGKALDLLLVSDLTPKEFVFGKLGGVFYNTKEMVVLPLGLCVYLWYADAMTLENMVYLSLALVVLYVFVAMVGIHTGMHYGNSRSAIGTSLGTVFFLFVGVALCMRMMLAFSGSFEAQLQPFLAFMVGGGIGLYVVLGARNPSTAIGVAAFACPLATFYAITSFFIDQTHLVFVAVVGAYGFTTVAMLIPAIDEFDVATGRTTIGEQ